jgi:predicted phosphodiesterase
MGEEGCGAPYSERDTVRYLVAADLHFDRHGDEYKETVLSQLEDYVDEYDCDTLLVAGDIGTVDDIERLLEADVPALKAVGGNNDEPYDSWYDPRTDRAFDDEITWKERLDEAYTIAMSHDPEDFGLTATRDETQQRGELDPDIIIYGHSHMPRDRIIDEKTLALGAGSTYRNYNIEDDIPDRSIHILEISDQITVKHLDFDTGQPVESSTYRQNCDSLEEDTELWDWSFNIDDRFVTS